MLEGGGGGLWIEAQGFPTELDPIKLEKIRDWGRQQVIADLGLAKETALESRDFGCHIIALEVEYKIGGYHESGIVLFSEAEDCYYDHHWNVLDSKAILDVSRRLYLPDGDPAYIPYDDLGADPYEAFDDFVAWLQADHPEYFRSWVRAHGLQDPNVRQSWIVAHRYGGLAAG